jgi:hypothetical protein
VRQRGPSPRRCGPAQCARSSTATRLPRCARVCGAGSLRGSVADAARSALCALPNVLLRGRRSRSAWSRRRCSSQVRPAAPARTRLHALPCSPCAHRQGHLRVHQGRGGRIRSPPVWPGLQQARSPPARARRCAVGAAPPPPSRQVWRRRDRVCRRTTSRIGTVTCGANCIPVDDDNADVLGVRCGPRDPICVFTHAR